MLISGTHSLHSFSKNDFIWVLINWKTNSLQNFSKKEKGLTSSSTFSGLSVIGRFSKNSGKFPGNFGGNEANAFLKFNISETIVHLWLSLSSRFVFSSFPPPCTGAAVRGVAISSSRFYGTRLNGDRGDKSPPPHHSYLPKWN